MAINVTTSSEKVTAAVSEDKVTATVSAASPVSATVTAGFGASGGVGPQGPSGVVNVTAPITNAGTTAAADIGISLGEGLSVSSGSLRVTPGTYATLVGGTVPSAQLPSYVDDVLEFANVASLPNTGETGKIYVALNTGRIYRWSGSAYFEISTPPDNTDAVPEGSSNLYFTNARARNSFGTGATGQVVAWSGSEWTAGTVVIASVTGLQTALDGKAASSHSHDASAINAGTLSADRLPLAAANTRGAVRIGSGISIDGNGVISASSGYTLPTATDSVLGGVKIGSGVTITDGVISVSIPSMDWASITNRPATFAPAAHKASHATGGSDALTAADIGAAAASHSHAASDVTSGTLDAARLPLATTTTAGAVIVGTGLGVSSGTVSVTYGMSSGQSCQGNDARLSDSRSPTSHASSHQIGGADAIASVVNSPSQIASSQNDYTLPSSDIVRLTSDAARDITGFVAGTSGQIVLLVNVGSSTITLRHQSASSTAANRMIVPWASDYLLDAGYAALLVYDGTTSRWRIV
jgi:hypothetical protein